MQIEQQIDRKKLTKAERLKVADLLAEERLETINARLEPVKVRDTFYTRYGKRLFDVIVSFAALVITLPVNLVIGVITFFDVGRPIFFHQERTGKDGKIFRITKFRNMTNASDERGELLPPKERVTKWGRFVRKTSLDELLNFWFVFIGKMSLVGPRPLPPAYSRRYHKRHAARLAVRPGLECPPRKIDGHVWTWQEQLDNDVWYVENCSFFVDCKMMIHLVRFAFDKKASNARAISARGTFMGYDEDENVLIMDAVPENIIELVCKQSTTRGISGDEKAANVGRIPARHSSHTVST